MTDNDFDAQRSELANRFASAGAEFLGQMPLAAAALAEVPNTQPQQYAMVGEPKAIRALPSDDMPARRMRHGQRPTEPLEWEPSAIANKATEEGGLPMDEQSRMLRTGRHVFDSAKRSGWKDDGEGAFEYVTRMIYAQAIAADRASRQVTGSQELLAELAEAADVFMKGGVAPLRQKIDQAKLFCSGIKEGSVSCQVANKAEVDLSSLNVQTGADIELVYCNRDEEFVRLDDVKALLTTPPATTGASTVLTDERIKELWVQSWNHYQFARLIASEVAAQAGQVAVPEGFMLVPRELTKEMRLAGVKLRASQNTSIDGIYAAMLAAAPSPEKESK